MIGTLVLVIIGPDKIKLTGFQGHSGQFKPVAPGQIVGQVLSIKADCRTAGVLYFNPVFGSPKIIHNGICVAAHEFGDHQCGIADAELTAVYTERRFAS